MVVYVVGTTLSLIFAYISTHHGESVRLTKQMNALLPKIFAFLSFVPLMVIMGFRHNVGTDFQAYANFFKSSDSDFEIGYSFLNNCLHYLTDDYQIIFIVSAIIICGCFFYSIYRESIDPVYSILLFVLCKDYFMAMNVMRQYLSTAIVLLSIPFLKRGKWIKSALIFLIAFLFHYSVVIFLFVFVLYKIKINPRMATILIGGTFVLSDVVFKFITSILARFDFYIGYFSTSSKYRNITGNFSWDYTLIFLCFYILLAYEYDNVQKSKELKLMYSGILTSLLVVALSSVMPMNVHRLTWHMNSLIVLYTPLAIKSLHNKKLGIILKIAIPVAYALVTIPRIINGNQGVLPYQSVLF